MAPVNSRRDEKELKDSAFNYFIAFSISPMETDASKIETQIKKVASKTGGDIFSRRLNELKQDALEIMCNDAVYDPQSGSYIPNSGGRAKEAKAAKAAKLRDTTEMVALLCTTRKTLLRSEILNLFFSANKPVEFFTEAEFFSHIQKELNGLGVKIVDNTDTQILFVDYKHVDNYLKALDKTNLYDFLGVAQDAPAAQIKDALDESAKRVSKISDLKKKQSYNTLHPLADKLLLKSASNRRYYDFYIQTKESIWEEFDIRKKFGYRDLPFADYSGYVQYMVTNLKVSLEEAEKFIGAGCKFYQMNIIGKTEDSNLEFCPYEDCGKLNISGAKACSHCGKPLEILCWSCGGKMPYTRTSNTCPTCKSTPQGKKMFEEQMAKLESVARKPNVDLVELQSALANLKNTVPSYSPGSNGYAAKKIKEYEALVAEKTREEQTTGAKYKEDLKKVQSLMAAKNYMQAQSAALNLKRLYPVYNIANTNGLLSDIDKVLKLAQTNVQSAKAQAEMKNEALVISFAAKALEICADCSEARLLLQKYPPATPRTIRQTMHGNTVRLEWDKSDGFGMTTYTVIKKVGSRPTRADDGTVLDANLSINFYEDSNISAATPYYYGVYAERCGVKSGVAVTTAPATVYLDVSGVRQEIVEDRISVRWECPHNVKAIEVWKKTGPVAPTGAGDGVKIPTDGLKGFVDEKCDYENSYLILCVYDAVGLKQYSPGIRRTLKKYESIRKIEQPRIIQQVTGEFTFTHATKGESKIRMIGSREKLACRYDTVTQMLDFNQVCKNCIAISHYTDQEGNFTFALPEGQVMWVYPMIYNEQLFMLSKPTLLNNVTGIRNVTYTEEQGTVLIKGTLHADTKQIIVKIGDRDFPGSVDGPEEKYVVSGSQFRADGGLSVKLKTNTVNYISLFVVLEKDGTTTVAKPVRVGDKPIDYREKVVVHHVLSYKPTPKGSFSVKITFAADEAVRLPRLCLVKGVPRPLTKNAGELVEIIEPVELKKGLFSGKYTAKVSITCEGCPVNTKFVLFPHDESVKYIQLKEVRNL